MIAVLSTAAHASDENVAVVQALRTAWLNGALIPRISAIFPGDIVQTKSELADIDAFGSKVLILKDSLLTYRSNEVELERGAVSVATSRALVAKVGNLTVRPVSANWTEFQVTDTDGTINIMARKGDLSLADETGTSTLNAGQETTRESPAQKPKKRSAGAAPAALRSLMDSKAALIVGAAAIGGVTGWVLWRSDDPISPDTP